MSRVWDKWNSWNCEVGYFLRSSVKLRLHTHCRLLFLGLENNVKQRDAIRYKHTRPHSGSVHKKKTGTRPCESAHRNRLFLKPLSRVDFLDLIAWMTEIGYFWSQQKTGPVVTWKNENFQVENGGQQCCRLSSPVLLHTLKSILLFWRQQLAISNSLKLWNLLVRDEGM